MSTTFQPFGLKPAYHPSGLDRAVPFVGTNSFTGNGYTAPYSLSAGQAFYQYQPVAIMVPANSLSLVQPRLNRPFTVVLMVLNSLTRRAVARLVSGFPKKHWMLRHKLCSGFSKTLTSCTKSKLMVP